MLVLKGLSRINLWPPTASFVGFLRTQGVFAATSLPWLKLNRSSLGAEVRGIPRALLTGSLWPPEAGHVRSQRRLDKVPDAGGETKSQDVAALPGEGPRGRQALPGEGPRGQQCEVLQ